MKINSQIAALLLALPWICQLVADTVATHEVDAPVALSTNIEGVVTANVSIPIEPNSTHTITIAPTNGTLKARAKVTVKRWSISPPLPPQLLSVTPVDEPQLRSTLVTADLVTNWNDFPPEHVIVPREQLPDGARRQWGTIVQSNFTHIIWHGRTNRVPLETLVSTNHLMRIVKPLVEISEPIPAVSTNTTNF